MTDPGMPAAVTPFVKAAVSLFVLVNPLEGVPVFMARTTDMDDARRAGIARTAAVAVTIVMLVAFYTGRVLLAVMGLSVGSFMIAGGILIFLIGVQMVLGATTAAPADGQAGQGDFAIVPLAIPLLAGPGVISGIIVYGTRGPTGNGCTPLDDLLLTGIILAVGLATWAALRAAVPLRRVLGDTGIDVTTRVAGLVVAAIAVEMIHDGLVVLFPGLGAR
jgi:multiple antibiotic resistance protein